MKGGGGGIARGGSNGGLANDDYTFQLLSMISSLLGSASGGSFIGRSTGVVYDLARHLVHGSPRVQRQVLSVLSKLLPKLDIDHENKGGEGGTADEALPLVPTLLYALAGSLSLQVRCKGQEGTGVSQMTASTACATASDNIRQLFSGRITESVAAGIIQVYIPYITYGLCGGHATVPIVYMS